MHNLKMSDNPNHHYIKLIWRSATKGLLGSALARVRCELERTERRAEGEAAALQFQLFNALGASMGSPGAGMAPQGCPKLRQGAWVFVSLHCQSPAVGCPLKWGSSLRLRVSSRKGLNYEPSAPDIPSIRGQACGSSKGEVGGAPQDPL